MIAWLESVGLGAYKARFTQHKVQGITLRSLTEAHAEEMGLPIGDRIALIAEIAKLTFISPTVLWEDDEAFSFHGPCDYANKMFVRPCIRKATCQRPVLWGARHLAPVAGAITNCARAWVVRRVQTTTS